MLGEIYFMRSTIIVALVSSLVGAVAGAGVSWIVIAKGPTAVLQNLSVSLVGEHLVHAKLLRKNNPEQVLTMLESTLPTSVKWFDALGYKRPGDVQVLWQIREYKEKYALTFPEEETKLLASLPPRPE